MKANSKTIAEGSITVHGISVPHVVQFSGMLKKIATAAAESKSTAALIEAVPIEDVVGLVDKCCVPSLTEVGAGMETIVEAIGAWLDLSFPKESASPFIRAVRSVIDETAAGISAMNLSPTAHSPTLPISSAPASLA